MLDFNRFSLIIFCVLFSFSAFSTESFDKNVPKASSVLIKTSNNPLLKERFQRWEVRQIDQNAIFAQAKSANKVLLNFNLGDIDINTSFRKVPILNPSYSVTSDMESNHTRAIALHSKSTTSEISLTVNVDFLYGFVTKNEDTWYIEPLWYFLPDAPKNQVIIYHQKDIIENEIKTCGVTEVQKMQKHIEQQKTPEGPLSDCHRVDIAIASDFLMFQKYGSVAQVENHNIGVINNVQTNYSSVFNVDFILNISTQYIVTNSGGDPWSSSTNPNTLLTSFRSWAQGNGFGTLDYDIGELWSDRDFNGTTIGLAYTSAICSAWRYHVLEDFSTNAALLRVLVAHEMGHNFDAVSSSSTAHDAPSSGFIMAPSVSSSTTWSPASISDINSYTAPLLGGCLPLVSCSGSAAVPDISFTASPTNVCVGNTVQFTDQSTENPTSWLWSFPGGTPSSSTDQNPLISYNTPGIYDVSLTATNATGSNTGTIQNYITVSGAPSFTASASGLLAFFTNTTNPAATSYLWDFGDPGSGTNNSSMSEHPSHTYPEDGVYLITLTAFSACGSTTFTLSLSVNTPATANFTASPTTVCTGDTVQFTSTSSSNTTQWNWTFPGGTPATSNLENPQVVYTTPGSYDVILTASSPAGGDTETKSNYITAIQSAVPGFSFPTPSGNSVTFTNTTTPLAGNTYSWNFGDGTGTSSDIHPTHVFPNPGNYTVTLSVITPSCGTKTISHSIQISNPPTCNFSASPISGCGPLVVQFTDLSANSPNTWLWNFPGGSPSTSTDQNPNITYNNPGNYTVSLTVTNGIGSDSKSITSYITVESAPTASFAINQIGNSVSFTNTSTSNATSYSWDFGDSSPNSTNPNPSHIYTTDGTYTVTLTATNACGSHTATAVVIISANTPTASISVAPSNTICIGETVNFTANVSANTQNVTWTFAGGTPATSTSMNPSVTFSTVGDHLVTLTAHNGSNTASANTTISVLPNTVASFASGTSGLTGNFTNTSSNATSYVWDFGDGATSTLENPSHTYISDGNYTVCLIATGLCGSDTSCATVTISGNGPSANIQSNVTSGCQPLTINYHADVSANTSSVQWTFGGGTPNNSTLIDQTVTYTNPGTYLTTLVATNPSGTSTDNLQVTVNPTVNAAFTSSANGPTVSFTNASAGNPTSYSWDFGDGSSSTMPNPTHQYATTGTFNVCLTVTNACGSHTVCHNTIIASFMPTAIIETTGPTTGCEPMTVNFHANVTNTDNVSWTFSGGNPSTSNLINPTVVFNSPGTHEVTLAATNTHGTVFANPESILVNPKPIANFTITVSGHLVTTNNLSQNGYSYLWDFGDGTILSSNNPGHLYGSDTVTSIQLITTNNCGEDTMSIQVTIGSAPSVDPIANISSGCGPLSVNFQANAQNAQNINWSFPTGSPSSSTDANPTIVFTTPGTHSGTVTVTNSLGEATKNVEIVVLPETVADFNFSIDDHTVNFSSTSQNATTLLWVFGDNTTAQNVNNAAHTYGDGEYTAMLIVTGACNSDTSYQNFIFGSTVPPEAEIQASGEQGCPPYEVTYTAQLTNNTDSFSWSFPNGNPVTSTDTTVIVTYDAVGDFVGTLVATNEFGSDTKTHNVKVLPYAKADFNISVVGLELTTTNLSTDADSYFWTFGDGASSVEENPVHLYAANGNYDIQLKVSNFCGDNEMSKNLFIVDIEDPLGEVNIQLFPNPNNGIFTLDVKTIIADDLDIVVFDILGRKVIEKHWSKTQSINEEINIENQPAGNYIFQLQFQGRILTGKFIKM